MSNKLNVEKLRDKMIFLCNSLVNMIGNANWIVFDSDSEIEKLRKTEPELKKLEPLCGYDVDVFTAKDERETISLIPAVKNDSFCIIVKLPDNKQKEFVYDDINDHATDVALHEFIRKDYIEPPKRKIITFGGKTAIAIYGTTGELYSMLSVGDVVKYYPDDCEVSSSSITSQLIIGMTEESTTYLTKFSDGTFGHQVMPIKTKELLSEDWMRYDTMTIKKSETSTKQDLYTITTASMETYEIVIGNDYAVTVQKQTNDIMWKVASFELKGSIEEIIMYAIYRKEFIV